MGETVRGSEGREAEGGRLIPPTPDPLPAGPPRKKGGRPSKVEKAAEEKAALEAAAAQRETEAQELSVIAGEALAIPFSIVAERRGAHWALSVAEKEQFSLAVSRIVVKYLPGLLLKYKEEAALLLISVAVIVPRFRQDKEIKAERERERERSGALRGDGHPGLRENDASEEPRRTAVAG